MDKLVKYSWVKVALGALSGAIITSFIFWFFSPKSITVSDFAKMQQDLIQEVRQAEKEYRNKGDVKIDSILKLQTLLKNNTDIIIQKGEKSENEFKKMSGEFKTLKNALDKNTTNYRDSSITSILKILQSRD